MTPTGLDDSHRGECFGEHLADRMLGNGCRVEEERPRGVVAGLESAADPGQNVDRVLQSRLVVAISRGESVEINVVLTVINLLFAAFVWTQLEYLFGGHARIVSEQDLTYSDYGRRGFFHPDEWTFGQSLHRSAIEGRIHRVTGVKHVVRITMKRFSSRVPATPGTEVLEMGFDEVLLLANDPSHLERGLIRFTVQGGRR